MVWESVNENSLAQPITFRPAPGASYHGRLRCRPCGAGLLFAEISVGSPLCRRLLLSCARARAIPGTQHCAPRVKLASAAEPQPSDAVE
jgi:hypothetical protein